MKAIAKMVALACGTLALMHCAVPNLPDDEGDNSGSTESGSPGGAAKLPPASADAPASTPTAPGAPATTPGTPGTPPVMQCDLSKPFQAPSLVAGLAAGQHFATPRLSKDELTVYFTMRDANGKSRIGRSVRTSLATPFGAATVLDAQSSTAKDNDPSVSADGASLWFSSERAGSNDKLYMASLVPGTAMFGAAVPVATVSSGATADDQHPYYRVNGGGELWFSSTRNGEWDIFVAKRNGAGFDAPKRVEELHATAATRQPMVSEDGLSILFASERAGGLGQRDLWTATRTSVATSFGAPVALSAVNSAADEFAGFISNDGCRVYFSSDRAAAKTHSVYVAERPAK
jgi:Tol biopolymer transport system component